jgi:hypothetical protein
VADAAQPLERGVEDRPGRSAADVGDEADATGVAFVERAVQRRLPSERVEDLERSRLIAIDLAGGGGERSAG